MSFPPTYLPQNQLSANIQLHRLTAYAFSSSLFIANSTHLIHQGLQESSEVFLAEQRAIIIEEALVKCV